jgi:hypothetical protein
MAFGGRRCLPNASRFHSIAVESRPSLKFMGQEPFAKVDVLRQSGLLKLLIPVEDGGLGGRWTDALKVTRAIAPAITTSVDHRQICDSLFAAINIATRNDLARRSSGVPFLDCLATWARMRPPWRFRGRR